MDYGEGTMAGAARKLGDMRLTASMANQASAEPRDAPIRRELERAHAGVETLMKEVAVLRDALSPVSMPAVERVGKEARMPSPPTGSQIGQSLNQLNARLDELRTWVSDARQALEV